LGNLSTPDSVQKLQTALHAKAKAEAGYRFYALYDKISREDILAHAYPRAPRLDPLRAALAKLEPHRSPRDSGAPPTPLPEAPPPAKADKRARRP
jgi:hypothetical protein